MSNITLAIEDEVLKKVRKIAVERNTTLTAMVRSALKQFAAREDLRTEDVIAKLRESFDTAGVQVGSRTWTREDIHAR